MLPTCSSSLFPTLSLASVESSERTAFIRTLKAWVAESPYDETETRHDFAERLTIAFDTNSTSFSFHGNINSLPACIGTLSRLENLAFSFCRKLTSLPPEIGNLYSLQTLSLCHCDRLTFLPPEIGNLATLRFLELSYTGLASLPPEIGRLSSLQNLSLASCTSLTSLPPEIGDLRSLQYLYLNQCMGLTYLPPEIGNLLICLKKFDLAWCTKLTSLPIETITLADLHPLEIQKFVEIFEKFITLLNRKRPCCVEDESIAYGSSVLQATGRFVKAFKERFIEKRLQNMQKELSQTHDAIASLQEDFQNHANFTLDESGPPLLLMVLDCFIAEDARVHCLRLQQEREDCLLQSSL